MIDTLAVTLIAILGGLAITLQGQFMGLMDQGLGTRESVFITYFSGGILAAIMMLSMRGGNLRSWQQVPWYAFTAGIAGLIIVGSIGYVVPRLGLATGFTIMIAAQFLLAALIDHFGWLGASQRLLDPTKSLGLLIMLVGVWLTSK
jgi:transporter family-2 protein